MKFSIALLAVASWAFYGAASASAITIQIDYSHDTNDFFNTQAKKDLLQDAANTLANRLTDQLTAITPAGGNSWNETFYDPATGAQVSVPNATIPANTVVIYAGGRDFGPGTLGQGGSGSYANLVGDSAFQTAVSTRGQGVVTGTSATDVAPWGGDITFNTNAQTPWSFAGGPPTGATYDFFSVAIHEIAHVLGFGDSASWDDKVSGSVFTGAYATAANGGVNVTLSSDQGHWQAGVMSDGRYATMDSALYYGMRTGFTSLDYAGLADIGWTLAPLGIPGDVNHDGKVDIQDLTQVANSWLTPNPAGDTNGDSFVDIQDLTVIANHWLMGAGGGGGSIASVPEPATIVSLGMAMLLLAAFGRHTVTPRKACGKDADLPIF